LKQAEKIKLFNDVFAPKSGEKVMILTDMPHNNIKDNETWNERRIMAKEWFETFKEMGENVGFSVVFSEYKATGEMNAPVPKKVLASISKVNIVIAMTEYSGSSSFGPVIMRKNSTTRGASMPLAQRSMEETAFKADYSLVKKYALNIEKILDRSISAEVFFSTGDSLFLDLRNRKAFSDIGECIKSGQFINFPSGEACKAPYEGSKDEFKEFGESKTEGILPVAYDEEIVKFVIEKNKIVELIGKSKKAEEMRSFFTENPSRRNIAELGIGCNPKAVIIGNILEDEKVGLHIAYGMSTFLGGKVNSDMHQDVCYSKGCPVEGTTLVLIHNDGSKTEIIKDAMLRYDLL